MAKPSIAPERGMEYVRAATSENPTREDTAGAVRYLLQVLGDRVPGHAVEVRVPPFGAVHCGEGPTHTRGTPPNVTEMNAETWIALATGRETWADAVARGAVLASGIRSDISPHLPVLRFS
ncbi:hypothetical protein C8A06_0790 [Microbacteriaceae bacterium MWH-Ta3]|nr:hypothetical protein C8A06_0790 [Microbacteriaceae bacterium MWH-Ta3]